MSAQAQAGFITFEAADSANLNFDDPEEDGGPGRSTATVPSGFARRVNLAVLTRYSPQDVHNLVDEDPPKRQWHQAWGYLALYPPRMANGATLHDNLKYDVRVTITGANFDAISYFGVLAIEDEHDDSLGPLKSLNWAEPLTRRSQS